MRGGSADAGMEQAHSVQPTASVTEPEPSLLQSILRRRKRVVLVTTAVTLLATVALTMQQTRIYSATSDVVVQAPPSQSPSTGPNMATEAQIARSFAVASLVQRRLRVGVPPSELLSQLAVHVPADSEVLKFMYSSPRPKVAQARAQAFAQAYTAVRRRQFEDQVLASATSTAERIQSMTTRVSTLRRRIERAPGESSVALRVQRDALTAEIALLQQQLAELNDAAASFSPATMLGSASLPRSPARPNLPVNVFLALLGGLLLGFGIAAIAEYMDQRVRGATDLRTRLGVPVLGLIPGIDDEVDRALPTLVAIDAPASEGADAFRRLRMSLVASAAEIGARSVAITSIDHDDVPIEFAANLAAVLAATGKRVVLLSPRRSEPRLAELLGAGSGPGFFDALAGAVPIEKAVSSTGVDNLFLCGPWEGPFSASRARIAAVASATQAQSLGTDRAARLIEELAASADFLLVDAPPLLADPDGAALAGACDGVLAVARPTTKREDIAQVREQLERVRARLFGSVLLCPKKRQRPRGIESLGSFTATVPEKEHEGGTTSETIARARRSRARFLG